MAEKLITLAKRDNEPAHRSAQGILYVCIPQEGLFRKAMLTVRFFARHPP
jgi:ribosomal protein L17